FFFLTTPPPPSSTLFPYTTLFRSPRLVAATKPGEKADLEVWRAGKRERLSVTVGEIPAEVASNARQPQKKDTSPTGLGLAVRDLDRKSTRLNSSHVAISYAVFCLK